MVAAAIIAGAFFIGNRYTIVGSDPAAPLPRHRARRDGPGASVAARSMDRRGLAVRCSRFTRPSIGV